MLGYIFHVPNIYVQRLWGKKTKFIQENYDQMMTDPDNRKVDDIINLKPMIIHMYKTIYAEDSRNKSLFELKAELGSESRLSPLLDKVQKAGQDYQRGEFETALRKYEKTYQILSTHDQNKHYYAIGIQIICGYFDSLWDTLEKDNSLSYNNLRRKEIHNHELEFAVDEPSLLL
jgi:hypothetical protein